MAKGLRKSAFAPRKRWLPKSALLLAAASALLLGSSASAQDSGGSCASEVGAASVLLAHRIESRDLLGAKLFVASLPGLLKGCSDEPMSEEASKASLRATHRSPYRHFAWLLVEMVRTSGSTADAMTQLDDALAAEGFASPSAVNPPGDGVPDCDGRSGVDTAFSNWQTACNAYLNAKNSLEVSRKTIEAEIKAADKAFQKYCRNNFPSNITRCPPDDAPREKKEKARELLKKWNDAKKRLKDAEKAIAEFLKSANTLANLLSSARQACRTACPDRRDQCEPEKPAQPGCRGFQ